MIPLLIAGMAIMVAGQLKAGADAKKAAGMQAAISEKNAAINEKNAILAEQEAAIEETRHRKDVQKLLGRQTAVYAKSGVVSSSGSAADVEGDTMYEGELDALLIRYNGTMRANAFRAGAANDRAQAQLTRFQGKSAQQASMFQAAGTILTGAGRGAFSSPASGGVNLPATYRPISPGSAGQDYYR